jgi:hypothetical protein
MFQIEIGILMLEDIMMVVTAASHTVVQGRCRCGRRVGRRGGRFGGRNRIHFHVFEHHHAIFRRGARIIRPRGGSIGQQGGNDIVATAWTVAGPAQRGSIAPIGRHRRVGGKQAHCRVVVEGTTGGNAE